VGGKFWKDKMPGSAFAFHTRSDVLKSFASEIFNNKVLARDCAVPFGKALDLYFDDVSWSIRR
jgi:hypothetical protein